MKTLKRKFYLGLILLCMLAYVSQCMRGNLSLDWGSNPHDAPPDTTPINLIDVTGTSSLAPAPTTANDAPISVCILVDFSGSMTAYKIAPPTVDDLVPLLHAVDLRGGTIAVGSIRARPTDPLDRLFIPPPEKPVQVETASNPFTRKKLIRQYRKEQPAYQAREEERRLHNRTKIADYIARLKEFFAREPGGGTDIWSSMTRCDLFLMEDPLYWTEATDQTPHRFIVAVSDGRHATDSPFRPVDRGIVVVVVTGRKGIGNFEKLRPDPTWFESSGSAIRYIVAVINKR